MLKKLSIFTALGLIAAGCSIKEDRSMCSQTFPVEVRVGCETKALQDITEYSGVKAIILAFYDSENAEVYKSTQYSTDAGYGNFRLALPLGNYTMVVLGYGHIEGDVLTLTSPTNAAFTSDHNRETFAAVKDVSVSGSSSNVFTAELERIISKLIVESSDKRTAGATNIRMTLSAGGKSFNPSTGLVLYNSGFSNTVNISTAVGAISTSVTYIFLNAEEQSIDVTVEALDADGNSLATRTIPSVPFNRNRTTRLVGPVYTPSSSASSFLLDTDWEDEYRHEYDF